MNMHKGFTLIELLAVAMILSVLTFISINLFNSVKARDQQRETQQRLALITAKIKQYYQTHGRLPEPAGTNKNEIPVQADALDMEQKYRLDAWGRYLVYNPGDINNNGQYVNIQDVEGFAASVESGGPDQNLDGEENNLIVFIDVTAEAIEITKRKLKVLHEKVAAYNLLFEGVDNNGDGIVDTISSVGNSAEVSIEAPGNTCPPTHSFINDPSEGLSTLSAIEETEKYNCPAPLVDHIVKLYGLPTAFPEGYNRNLDPVFPDGYERDPWKREFKWGYEGRLLDDGTPIETSDRRYHRFFSSGPDDSIIDDDIVSTGD